MKTFVTIKNDALVIESKKKWAIKTKEDWNAFLDAVEEGEEIFKRFTFSSSLNHAEEETTNKFVQRLAVHLVYDEPVPRKKKIKKD